MFVFTFVKSQRVRPGLPWCAPCQELQILLSCSTVFDSFPRSRCGPRGLRMLQPLHRIPTNRPANQHGGRSDKERGDVPPPTPSPIRTLPGSHISFQEELGWTASQMELGNAVSTCALESYSGGKKPFLRPRMNKSRKTLSATDPPSGGRKRSRRKPQSKRGNGQQTARGRRPHGTEMITSSVGAGETT